MAGAGAVDWDLLYEIVLFYGFQFNDFWSSYLGIKKGAIEANPIFRPFVRNPFIFALFKFGLASLVFLVYSLVAVPIPLATFLWLDSIGEVLVTFWNTYQLAKR